MKRWVSLAVVVLSFVLLPFFLFGESVEQGISEVLLQRRGPGLAFFLVAALVVDVALPVPSSLIASYACQQFGPLLGLLIIMAGASGALAAAYGIGRGLGTAGTERTLGQADYARAVDFGERRGAALAVALSRALPVLAEAIGLLAGALRWPFLTTMLWGTSASFGMAVAYAVFFAWVGSEASGWHVLLGATVVPGVALLLATFVLNKRGSG